MRDFTEKECHTTERRFAVLKKVCAITVIFISTMVQTASCCTVFTASIGDTVLFGNNEDAPETDAYAWFYPRTETEYGAVYFGFSGFYTQGGMNDQGLCFDITTVPELKMRPHPERLSTLNFGERALKLCSTVEEVIQLVEQYDFSRMGMAQFLFADMNGDSVIVCPSIDGEMKTIQKEGVYQVVTNFNVTYPALGGHPCRRYATAAEMLKKIESEEDITVGYFATILRATSQNTSYSTVYDLRKGIICFFSQSNFSDIIVFNLEEELEIGYHSYYMPLLFQKKGEPVEKPKSKESQSGKLSEESEVVFSDKNLEQAIREAIGKNTEPIYASDLEKVTYLEAKEKGITRIEGLEYCKNLAYLHLGLNSIVDISPLAALANIRELVLHENSISDISPLMMLTNLEVLYLNDNSISDISPLTMLTNLEVLYLNDNSISDISPLVLNYGISSGDAVDVGHNPLSEESIEVYIPELEKRGVRITWMVEGESPRLLYVGVAIAIVLLLLAAYVANRKRQSVA